MCWKVEQVNGVEHPDFAERLWIAVVYSIGAMDVFGAGWDRDRLHRTRAGAEAEILEIAAELGLSPIHWTEITEVWSIGRCHRITQPINLYGATVRGVRVPD